MWWFGRDKGHEDVTIPLVFLITDHLSLKFLAVLGVFYWCESGEQVFLTEFFIGIVEWLGCLAVHWPVLALGISRSWEDDIQG